MPSMDTFMTFLSNGTYPVKKENDTISVETEHKSPHEPQSTMDEINTQNDHQINNENINLVKENNEKNVEDENEFAKQILDDEVLNEFLNPNFLNQQNNILDYIDTPGNDLMDLDKENDININNIENNENLTNKINNASDNTKINDIMSNTRTLNLADEIKHYEESKEELMKIKFGLNQDSRYIYHSNIGFCYTKELCTSNPEDPEVTTTLLPSIYQENFLKDESSFPYKLSIEDLPTHSRVETQIKLELSISPPPPQFLLHLPRDSITKPKFTLADNTLSASIEKHLLYLDVFVIGAQSLHSKDERLRSCNVCKRCMRRELKRASRRKAGLVDDSSNWDINLPKRAIIFNSKEIVSFPAPNGNVNERKIELLSRIVCYCRHHQELDGFQLLIFLKNKDGLIVGKTLSTPILIMDRKKALKPNLNDKNKENFDIDGISTKETSIKSEIFSKNSTTRKTSSITSINSNDDSASELSGVTSSTNINKNSNTRIINSLTNSNSSSITNMNILSTNNNKSQTGIFSSLFSFDPANILGDENSRQAKRQKRPWSQSESSTYFETISQQRGMNPQNVTQHHHQQQQQKNLESNKISIKKEAVSPLSSDAISPQNHMFSSATSVFSTTPERKGYSLSINLSPSYENDLSISTENRESKDDNISQSVKSSYVDIDSNMNANIDLDIDMTMNMNMNMNLNNQEFPTIRRIIPAQGPIRGGIEITLLGSNFRPGLNVKFGSNIALATQCWSDSTIVTYLPPASQAGPVLVTFEDPNFDFTNSSTHQIFTYTDDTDRQLIELALQIVGLKMNGKLEDAKNIAKRIVGNNQIDTQTQQLPTSGSTNQLNQQLQLNWMAVASNKIKELSKSSLNHEEILIKFLTMIKIPNSPILSPNWAVCNSEGQTMLHLACFKNYGKLTQFLIKNGSRVDYKDMNGFSPLHFAFISGNRKIIHLLANCKANLSNRLDNGVLLSDISDSNVLDLINSNRRLSNASSDIDFDDYDDDYNFEDEITNNFETENEAEEYSDYELTHKSHHYKNLSKRKTWSSEGDEDEEFEADNEDDSDFISEEKCVKKYDDGKLVSNNKETNSFGHNLWIAMKEALKNKMVEVSIGQEQRKPKSRDSSNYYDSQKHSDDIRRNEDKVEELPSYDDLFPDGTTLRSLINFRGHGDDDIESKRSKIISKSKHLNPDVNIDEEDSDVDMIAMNLQSSIDSDTKLLFFWLPCMLVLLLIVIGNHLNIITLQNFQMFSYFLKNVREIVGSFMLGKDRFTNLLNENINYGRERMENLINDVNDAMMTAVAGVAR